ncbi:hypothetical protein FLAV_00283 [Flavobacteriales bacterium]|nr:hypothetical protein [Flavobacteriales bacterium]CAG0952888.1 hypothetical protein FLAV_00283 [Flavobacteriales bacterium]
MFEWLFKHFGGDACMYGNNFRVDNPNGINIEGNNIIFKLS